MKRPRELQHFFMANFLQNGLNEKPHCISESGLCAHFVSKKSASEWLFVSR